MAMTITCPHCGAAGSAPEQIKGQTVRCSKCKQSFVAGGGASAPPPPPPMAADEGIHEPAGRRSSRSDDYEEDYEEPRRRRSISTGGSGFGDFVMFRRMVAPIIIMIIFWVGVIGMVVTGLIGMVAGAMSGRFEGVFIGLMMTLIGPLYVRVMCEVMIVIFRISETLTDIKNVLERRS